MPKIIKNDIVYASGAENKFREMTQAQYDAIKDTDEYDSATIYLITDADSYIEASDVFAEGYSNMQDAIDSVSDDIDTLSTDLGTLKNKEVVNVYYGSTVVGTAVRVGNVCSLNINVTLSTDHDRWNNFIMLPDRVKPSAFTYLIGGIYGMTSVTAVYIQIGNNGAIQSNQTLSSGTQLRFGATYICD